MMRKRPSRIAPGAKRPWLIESDEVSHPPDDEGDLRSGRAGARVAASSGIGGCRCVAGSLRSHPSRRHQFLPPLRRIEPGTRDDHHRRGRQALTLARSVGAAVHDEHPTILGYDFSYSSGVESVPFELYTRAPQRRVIFSFRTEGGLYAVFVGVPVDELNTARRAIETTFFAARDLAPDFACARPRRPSRGALLRRVASAAGPGQATCAR